MVASHAELPETPTLELSPGSFLAHDPDALYEHAAEKVEAAIGMAMPQMQVRVRNVSLSARAPISSDRKMDELPTLVNDIKHAAVGMMPGKSKVGTKHILHNINAVFEPGTMTLVLGQPGAGKSALLKMLSGRFPMTNNIKFNGEITYNGVTREDVIARLPQFVTYVAQRDTHFPTLTVKETLEFAHECCGAELTEYDEKHFVHGTEEENKAALEAARAIFRHYPEIVTQQLGLEHCQNTIVGDAMIRGVSGGERKRVTTGEMEFGNKFVTLQDEISTGLDSAATYDIVKTQRGLARKLRKTVVTALLQPSPEVFNLFDYVLILNEGHVMYHGPIDKVVGYFELLGFICPPNRDVADFLMDLGTVQQTQYEVIDKVVRPPRYPSEFASRFRDSEIHAEMLADVLAPVDPEAIREAEAYFGDVPEFYQSFWASVKTLISREQKLIWRNEPVLKGRAAMVLVVSLVGSTLFYRMNTNNAQVVVGTLYAAILFFGFSQATQIPTFMEAREVFYKQRGANFYRTSAYVIASSFGQIPLSLIETLVFGSIVYWMCGFANDFLSFFTFEVLLFSANLAFLAWFFFLSAVSPNLHIGEPLSMVSVMFFILFAGFTITRNDIPSYFIWAYWFNPISWCMRAMAINHFRSEAFDVCVKGKTNYCARYGKRAGEYLLSVYEIQSGKEWLWYGIAYMIGTYVFFMVLSTLILEYYRYESPDYVTVSSREASGQDLAASRLDTTEEYQLAHTPRDVSVDMSSTTRQRPFTPVTIAFKDLWYSVLNPANPSEDLELLKGISGYARPGTMTALMGSSGAGKTTLMDVMAGRKTGGKIRGQILLNGYEATDLAIRRSTGYCEQMDIHSEASTIREALTFSAFLRQSADIPASQKYDSVEECLDLLDLRPIADQIVRGSTVEQMKRLTIGVELAARPSVLFLDEPTSGLDARSAKLIMDGVRKIANTGRTIVCTIHQPSWEVFSVFDSLLLLKLGGETVFFGELGENASALVEYFESIDGVAPLPKNYNPATWMLEVIGAGVGNTAGKNTDFVAIFNASQKKAALESELNQDGVTRPAPGVSALTFEKKRAATNTTQARLLLQRFMNAYWRTSAYNLTRFAVFATLALVFGVSFVGVKYDTYRGLNAGVGLVFATTVFIGGVSFESVLPITAEDRGAYYRERASQTYNSFWYFIGSTLAEIPYVFGSCLVFCGIFYPMAGFTGLWRFVLYWIHTSLHVLLQTYIGQFFAFAFYDIEVAMIAGVIMNCVFFIFMGYNPAANAIPKGYKWLYHLVPPKYSFGILASLVFGECTKAGTELGCKPLRGELPVGVRRGITVRKYVERVYKIDRDDLWTNFAVVIGYIVLVRVFTLLALRYVNHQRR